jgi:hypothetical protein
MPKYYLKDKQRFAIPVVDTLDNFLVISDIEYSKLLEGVQNGYRVECIDDTLILVPNEIPDNSAIEYKILRAQEYPPITDYIDGVVKGDQQQIDDYIAKCLAVKAKYPKPE